MSEWLQWLDAHLLACPLKALTGLDCPGCGFQRSGLALLRGELLLSLKLFPAFIPFVFTWLLLLAHLRFRFNKGALYLRIAFIFTAVLVFGNYFIKTTLLLQQLH